MKLFADNIPIYLQLKAEMEEAILNQSLKPHDALESIRALAARYRINPLTVSRAIQELEEEGVIYKRRGIGFYVSPHAPDILKRRHLQQYLKQEVQSFTRKARQLGISLSDMLKLVEENYLQTIAAPHPDNDKKEQ